MAQLVKFDAEEVFKKVGVKLPLCGDGDGNLGFGVQQRIFAMVNGKDLTKEVPSSWTYWFNGTAEFLGGNVTNSGSYDVSKLSEAKEYGVFYCLAMKDHQLESTVQLTLELPDRSKQVNDVKLTVKPMEFQPVSVGKFVNKYSEGNIKFSFSVANGDTWIGLLIGGVIITRV